MIRASNDLSRFTLNGPTSQSSDSAATSTAATPLMAGVPTMPPMPQQAQRSHASLSDLKRLSQSLKPRRQAAPITADQTYQKLEQSVEPSQRYSSEQFLMPVRPLPISGLPVRRPVSLEDIGSLKPQSMQLIEQMAGPSARILLLSSLFQSPANSR